MRNFGIYKFTDQRDQRVYKYVKIGELLIMVDNLECKSFQNGDPISEAKDSNHWKNAASNLEPCMCTLDYHEYLNQRFGNFYNNYAMQDERGIAPEGWRVLNCKDVYYLIDYIENAGLNITGDFDIMFWEGELVEINRSGKIPIGESLMGYFNFKEAGLFETEYIKEWNTIALQRGNRIGFSAQPFGYCNNDGVFEEYGESSCWWVSKDKKYKPTSINYRLKSWSDLRSWLYSDIFSAFQGYGFNVRCVKDVSSLPQTAIDIVDKCKGILEKNIKINILNRFTERITAVSDQWEIDNSIRYVFFDERCLLENVEDISNLGIRFFKSEDLTKLWWDDYAMKGIYPDDFNKNEYKNFCKNYTGVIDLKKEKYFHLNGLGDIVYK